MGEPHILSYTSPSMCHIVIAILRAMWWRAQINIFLSNILSSSGRFVDETESLVFPPNLASQLVDHHPPYMFKVAKTKEQVVCYSEENTTVYFLGGPFINVFPCRELPSSNPPPTKQECINTSYPYTIR